MSDDEPTREEKDIINAAQIRLGTAALPTWQEQLILDQYSRGGQITSKTAIATLLRYGIRVKS